MNRVSAAIIWGVVNGVMAVCLYAGYFGDNQFARNTFNFFYWLSIVVATLSFATKEGHRHSVPQFLSVMYDMGILIALSGTGHFWMAGGWFYQMIAEARVRMLPRKDS